MDEFRPPQTPLADSCPAFNLGCPYVSGSCGLIKFAFSSAWLQSLPPNSFVGCLRNFQLNLKPLNTIAASVAVSPCLSGSVEKGIYFSQEGGHIILGKGQFGTVYVFESEELHPFS